MPRNRLQILYNLLEREATGAEETFLTAEKSRFNLRESYESILKTIAFSKDKLAHYPQAAVLKRLGLIETLLKDLMLRHETERRYFNAVGFLLSRLRQNLATEMLEPRIYKKIRAALEEEESFRLLREKFPDAEAVVTAPKNPAGKPKQPRTVRLLLIGAARLHYAIPVTRLVKKAPAAGPLAQKLLESGFTKADLPVDGKPAEAYTHAIAYLDLKGVRRLVYCDAWFTPVEIPQRLLRKKVLFAVSKTPSAVQHRPYFVFYGRHFFVYGARLSYTVRPGGRRQPIAS